MPGYRFLSPHHDGLAAERVREAEQHQRNGEHEESARLLELAMEDASGNGRDMPAWICGRLAAAYRALARYDDEVELLERFCSAHASTELATRYIARLSKARAIADRSRRVETGALRTVKEAKRRLRATDQRNGDSAPSAAAG